MNIYNNYGLKDLIIYDKLQRYGHYIPTQLFIRPL